MKELPNSDVYLTVTKKDDSYEENRVNYWYPGISVTDCLMLDWIKKLETKNHSKGIPLLELIQQRKLYKRICTIERPLDERFTKLNKISWLSLKELCESVQERIYAGVCKRREKVTTMSLIYTEEIDILFKNNLVVLIDIPSIDKLTNDRPLYYAPELQGKTYYRDSILPREAKHLSQAIEGLVNTVSQIRILCHPDVYQWINRF